MKRLFKKEELLNLGLPYDNCIYDEIVDQTRWSTIHEIVFPYEGSFYKAHYQVGSTECQEERPWEFLKEVECLEVEPKEKTVICWVEKKG